MNAETLAEAYRRVTTDNQEPPRPWAYLANKGITSASEVGYLHVAGFTDQAGFDVVTDSGVFRVMISRIAT